MKRSKSGAKRKPPQPAESHAEIEDWFGRQMPDLQPIVDRLDELIGETMPKLHYAVKWQKAYYGTPDLGWVIEMVAYDVSVNVVFLGGADFAHLPPDGTGQSRVRPRSLTRPPKESARDLQVRRCGPYGAVVSSGAVGATSRRYP